MNTLNYRRYSIVNSVKMRKQQQKPTHNQTRLSQRCYNTGTTSLSDNVHTFKMFKQNKLTV